MGTLGANTDVTNSNITVSNNTITNTDGNGIIATGINNAGTFNIRIIDNNVTTVPDLGARFGIRVQQSNVGTQPTINLEMHGQRHGGRQSRHWALQMGSASASRIRTRSASRD